jgi:hypothetical protein
MDRHDNRTKVVILTDTFRIKGYIDLLPGARVTDYIIAAKDFIVVTDAEVWSIEGGRLALSAEFIDVSRDSIEVITTTDTQQPLAAVAGIEQAVAMAG